MFYLCLFVKYWSGGGRRSEQSLVINRHVFRYLLLIVLCFMFLPSVHPPVSLSLRRLSQSINMSLFFFSLFSLSILASSPPFLPPSFFPRPQMCGPNSEMGNDVRVGLQVLRKLLQYGVDVSVTDHDGRTPLLWAASAGRGTHTLPFRPSLPLGCLGRP